MKEELLQARLKRINEQNGPETTPEPAMQPSEQSPQTRRNRHDDAAVEDRIAISAQVVYRAVLAEGEAELERPTSALAFSGLAAGLSMGFSFLTEGLLRAHLPESAWAPLIAKLGYPVGFVIVILGRQQLFTENTLTPILPLLKHKQLKTLLNTLRLWGVVLLANWVGTLAFAWMLAHWPILEESVRSTLLRLGQDVLRHDFGTMLLKAVFAGWLIALLVWLLPFAETGRVSVILLMTYVISLGSFSHVVAGSVDAFYVVASGGESWGRYLGGFMLPTLLGNVLGGVALVAALNHAQVTAGDNEQS